MIEYFKYKKPSAANFFREKIPNTHIPKYKISGRVSRWSSIRTRILICYENPIRPTQPGLSLHFYWRSNRFKNPKAVEVFSKCCPIGKNIRKFQLLKKHRKHKTSERHVKLKFSHRNTEYFKQLYHNLSCFPGKQVSLIHGSSWISKLGTTFPLLGG